MWHFFHCLKKEEVVFRQQWLKMQGGLTKNKSKKTVALQKRIDTLGSQFEQNQIDLDELVEGLSLLVGSSK